MYEQTYDSRRVPVCMNKLMTVEITSVKDRHLKTFNKTYDDVMNF